MVNENFKYMKKDIANAFSKLNVSVDVGTPCDSYEASTLQEQKL